MAAMSDQKVNARGFVAAWLGWAFDGLDGYIYGLVALPFVMSLVRGDATFAKQSAAWIQAAFMFGWAIGGAVFGRIGDRIGRSRTLTLTILTYAVFTGLSFFAQEWWHLLIFRFVAALGIGGEWAAGSALVTETLHPRHRAWASATLQSGYMCGMIGAALTVGAQGALHLPERYVFLVGVIPALMTIWIRKAVPEPAEWAGERHQREMPKLSALFAPEIRAVTLRVLSMTSICLTTIWAFLFFNPQILQGLAEVKALPKPDQAALIRNVTIEFCLWNIVGNYVATYLAKMIGYRKAFALYLAAACFIFIAGFRQPFTLSSARLWFDLTMFFGTGVFAIFPLYIPALFPTLLRTTGAGFCYNFGRLVAGIGTLAGGWITAKAGGPAMAVWWVGFLYIPGVLLSFFMPEVPYKESVPEHQAVLATG
jgi:predicted MFS family arabinose efflux permease